MHGTDTVTAAEDAPVRSGYVQAECKFEETDIQGYHGAAEQLLDAVDVAARDFVSWPGRMLSAEWYLRAGYFPRGC